MEYIKKIRDLREDHDYTQEYVAQYLGTSQTMYARYERGANEEKKAQREADRVVEIYHQMRKLNKEAANKSQQVVVKQTVDPLEQLEKLNKLKEAGILSEEEFNQKKADLLSKL